MKKNVFDIYKVRLLRDINIGEEGFVVIDPLNTSKFGTSLLTDELFIIKSTLYFFDDLNQARKYLEISGLKFYVLWVRRIGGGINNGDDNFIIDLSYMKSQNFVGFSLVYFNNYHLHKYKNNDDYICFSNIKVRSRNVGMDRFLSMKEKYYSNGNLDINTSNNYKNIKRKHNQKYNLSKLYKYTREELERLLEFVIQNEDFEIAVLIRDEIKSKSQQLKQKE